MTIKKSSVCVNLFSISKESNYSKIEINILKDRYNLFCFNSLNYQSFKKLGVCSNFYHLKIFTFNYNVIMHITELLIFSSFITSIAKKSPDKSNREYCDSIFLELFSFSKRYYKMRNTMVYTFKLACKNAICTNYLSRIKFILMTFKRMLIYPLLPPHAGILVPNIGHKPVFKSNFQVTEIRTTKF